MNIPRHALWAALPLALCSSAMAADAVRGERLYESRCGGCHAIDDNRIGPRHAGVLGRKAGSVKDFEYSPALRKSNVVWTPALLDQWLQNPEKLIPGQRMGFRLTDSAERADIIAYLATQTPAR